MVHNPGPGPSVSGPDTSGWRTYQQRQAPSPDNTRHCPLCEDHARRAAWGQEGETEPARLDWLYAQGVRVCDARCEPDTRPGDMFPEVWDGSWEYTQDKTAFLRGIGIGIQWAPCDHPAWEPAALEWLRQGGIRVKAGVVDWRGSEVQPGAEFYADLDAALQKLDKEAGAGE